MEVLKNISAILGLVLTIASVITLISKSVRSLLSKIFLNYESVKKSDIEELKKMLQGHIEEEQKKEPNNQKCDELALKQLIDGYVEKFTDILKSLQKQTEIQQKLLTKFAKTYCRDTLKNIYYRYYNTKKLPLHERNVIESINDFYVGVLSGNSYAKGLIKEMLEWEVDYFVGAEEKEV